MKNFSNLVLMYFIAKHIILELLKIIINIIARIFHSETIKSDIKKYLIQVLILNFLKQV